MKVLRIAGIPTLLVLCVGAGLLREVQPIAQQIAA